MHSDTKSWMRGAAEWSMSVLLMTAETLAKKSDALDEDETQQLHWCWECIESIMSAKLACAQLEAHEAANAPASLDDLMRMMRRMQAKLGIIEPPNGNGNGVVKPAA